MGFTGDLKGEAKGKRRSGRNRSQGRRRGWLGYQAGLGCGNALRAAGQPSLAVAFAVECAAGIVTRPFAAFWISAFVRAGHIYLLAEKKGHVFIGESYRVAVGCLRRPQEPFRAPRFVIWKPHRRGPAPAIRFQFFALDRFLGFLSRAWATPPARAHSVLDALFFALTFFAVVFRDARAILLCRRCGGFDYSLFLICCVGHKEDS